MRKLRDYALAHVMHPLKRQIIREESRQLLETALNTYT
jgi:hypothetical protein